MSRLLVDTHVLLWALGSPELLSRDALRAIEDEANDVFVSTASTWEIGIKAGLGKLDVPADFEEHVHRSRFASLAVDVAAGLAVRNLPHHHGDPFDRMLVVQAQLHDLTIVTRDQTIPRYDVAILEA